MTIRKHDLPNGYYTLDNVTVKGSVCPFVVVCNPQGVVTQARAKTINGFRAPTRKQTLALYGIALAYYLVETEAGRDELAATTAKYAN